jgi:uncharacterized caspase-like protein
MSLPRLVLAGLLACLLSGPALAENRVAFVVGNSEYEHTSPLRNPANDARVISETLRALDFTVSDHYDLTRDEMTRALSEFLRTNAEADVTLFYFAGHGMQFEGRNYLIGTDARLQSEFDVTSEALDLERVTAMLERQSRAALVFVDACRNNPLADDFYRTNFSDTRATMSRGLAPVQTTSEGSMVVFSAAPGQVAQDGSGANSPFAEALVRHLPTENAEVLSLMKRVIRDVKAETGDAQVPMVTNDLVTEIYLNLGAGGAGAALAFQQEETLFEAALSIGTQRGWDIYLSRYPQGNFREIALAERERLQVVRLAAASGVEVVDGQPVAVTADVAETLERSLGLSRADNIKVQEALNARGYDVGNPDGAVGPRTRRALSRFQTAVGLQATGVITEATAVALEVTLEGFESGAAIVAASADARRYDPEQLAIIENDDRLLKAVRELQNYELVYGFHDGRLYVVPLVWGINFQPAKLLAERAGGYLASIGSAAENQFIFDLIRQDDRLWKLNTRGIHSFGPWIGMYQTEGAREPRGGFVWVTGEPVTYTNFMAGNPSNTDNEEHFMAFAHYHAETAGAVVPGPTWDDLGNYNLHALVIEIE